MKLSARAAGYATLAATAAAVAAGLATLALGSPAPHATPARSAGDAQATRIVYRYLDALRAHDWPGACTLVQAQAACLRELASDPDTFGRFDVIAATATQGRAVASVTVDGVPCRVTLVRSGSGWLIRTVELSSAASAGPAPAGSTAPGA